MYKVGAIKHGMIKWKQFSHFCYWVAKYFSNHTLHHLLQSV